MAVAAVATAAYMVAVASMAAVFTEVAGVADSGYTAVGTLIMPIMATMTTDATWCGSP